MATPRDIRRLALLALYQLDATGAAEPDSIRASLDDLESLAEEGLEFVDPHAAFTPADTNKAFAIATGAWEHRDEADAEIVGLAPEWPPGRQAAVDRAILRLAHHEITRSDAPPKAVVNEAVELAKAFSTENSPSFVNGVLGKVLKRAQGEADASGDTPSELEPNGAAPGAAEG
ncbi:MAG: N utilization substance protein B [Phycisphaeraceae bacterium]|nr:MAG: N utilization substance protein B [Phycisphaeraceae bacterium]